MYLWYLSWNMEKTAAPVSPCWYSWINLSTQLLLNLGISNIFYFYITSNKKIGYLANTEPVLHDLMTRIWEPWPSSQENLLQCQGCCAAWGRAPRPCLTCVTWVTYSQVKGMRSEVRELRGEEEWSERWGQIVQETMFIWFQPPGSFYSPELWVELSRK